MEWVWRLLLKVIATQKVPLNEWSDCQWSMFSGKPVWLSLDSPSDREGIHQRPDLKARMLFLGRFNKRITLAKEIELTTKNLVLCPARQPTLVVLD